MRSIPTYTGQGVSSFSERNSCKVSFLEACSSPCTAERLQTADPSRWLLALGISTWQCVGLAAVVEFPEPQSRVITGLALEGSKPGENVYEQAVSSHLLSSVCCGSLIDN